MTCKIDLRDLITQEAQRQGVDPSLALSVAQTESSTCQWAANGNVVTSPRGALGVFQLLPSTAAQLGVDPTDVNDNIRGGITYLKQLYQKYGTWDQALAAYNWGPGNVDKAAAAGTSWPVSVYNYAAAIIGRVLGTNAAAAVQAGTPPPSPTMLPVASFSASDILSSVMPSGDNTPVIAGLALVGIAAAAWWLSD
jgi:transglycosylase-like protein with SLT domain